VLCCVGDLCQDVVVWPTAPVAVGDDTTARIVTTRGGSAANVAYFAASIGLPARFIGAVGADQSGAWLARELTAAGVDVRVQQRERTATVVVLVGPSGDRTMLSDRGSATDLRDVSFDWLEAVTWLHIPMYSLVVDPLGSTAAALAAEARRRGIIVSVDASSGALLAAFGVERAAALVGPIDVLLANEAEAETIAGRWPAPIRITKRGAASTLVDVEGSQWEVPVAAVAHVRDSTGAGDAFAAGFIAARLGGCELTESVVHAHSVAAQVLAVPGAELG
jgi:sugar/nucleoside kinase (ribokinase family)